MFSVDTIYRELYAQYIARLHLKRIFELKKMKTTAIWQSRQGRIYMFREARAAYIGYGGVGS